MFPDWLQGGVVSPPIVALLLRPDVQEEGLQPLQFPHLTAAGTATVADLQTVHDSFRLLLLTLSLCLDSSLHTTHCRNVSNASSAICL